VGQFDVEAVPPCGTAIWRGKLNSVQIEFIGLGCEMRLCRLLCGRALPFREPQSKTNLFSLGAKAPPSRPARTLKCPHLPGKPQAFRTVPSPLLWVHSAGNFTRTEK
jgi:hypothetical protein